MEKEKEKDHKGGKEKHEDGMVAEKDNNNQHEEEEDDTLQVVEKGGQGQGQIPSAVKAKKARRGQVEVLMDEKHDGGGGVSSTASAPGLGAGVSTGTQENPGSEGVGVEDGADSAPRYQSHRINTPFQHTLSF